MIARKIRRSIARWWVEQDEDWTKATPEWRWLTLHNNSILGKWNSEAGL